MTISEDQSYSLIIRDMFFAAVAAMPDFAMWTKRRTPPMPIQGYQLPLLGIYLLDETMTPDGLGNHGEIKFIHNQKIGVSIIVVNNDPEAAEKALDHAFWIIWQRLWQDPYMMNFYDTFNPNTDAGNPDNVRVESIERSTRRFKFGAVGNANETPVAELQYEITCRFRSYWPPIITDDLLEIDVRTAVPIGSTEEEQASRPQAEAHYIFTPRPSKVTGLATTLIVANEVDLAWTAATGDISGYVVQHSIHEMSHWRTYSVGTDPNLLIEQVKRLAPTTPYDFRVCATGEGGDGDWSDVVSATTTAITPPAPPQVTGLAVGTITASSIDLAWDATADTSRYRVQVSPQGDASWFTFSSEYNATAATATGLAANTAYDFRVSASGPGGDGPWSTIVSATTTL